MIRYEDECVDCPPEMGCMGSACPYRNVPHACCDMCEEEAEEFYYSDGDYLCKDCYIEAILEQAEVISAEKLIERNWKRGKSEFSASDGARNKIGLS